LGSARTKGGNVKTFRTGGVYSVLEGARVETANEALFFHHAQKTSPQVKIRLEKKRKVQHFLQLNKSLEQGLNLSGS